ncbi:Protein CBG14263 [Caenorhabditis briggsae]|uniref:Protein CBG14263 n=2 Tax=Caenorhabditis briggsae TaxID=6238 RepID=A8XJM5_CAEBR|nr:Protein CBG14263 [Caenorhabditis briggsae]CAP32851.2 Protein CBG14263 [Caenorhabditis briggsae]
MPSLSKNPRRKGIPFLKFTWHLKDEILGLFRNLIVNAKLWDSSAFGEMDMKKILECVQEAEFLKIGAEIINKEMINLMQKVSCTKRFHSAATNTMGSISNGILQCSDVIHANNFQWFDPERFQDLCCRSMCLLKARITTRNVEDLIIEWGNSEEQMGEGVKNIKLFEVQVYGVAQNFDFTRVGAQPPGRVQRPNEYMDFNVMYDFTTAFDIIHQDGTLASLTAVEGLDHVRFIVWDQ